MSFNERFNALRAGDVEMVRRLVTRSSVPTHARYLRMAGFVPDPAKGPGWFTREVEAGPGRG